MKKITLSLIALVALGGVALGQGAVKPGEPGEAIDTRPEAVIGFAERSGDEQQATVREPGADDIVSALMADDARYSWASDEGRFLQLWALSNREERPEEARAAFRRTISEFGTVARFGTDRAELEAILATTNRGDAGSLARLWAVRNDQRDAIPSFMAMLKGRGVTDAHYQTWYRQHLSTLPVAEAIASLETELRGLLASDPNRAGRTEAIRELRAQLIILRDLAGD